MTITIIFANTLPTRMQMITGVSSKNVIRNSIRAAAVRWIRDPE
jgi:hypothetical protein